MRTIVVLGVVLVLAACSSGEGDAPATSTEPGAAASEDEGAERTSADDPGTSATEPGPSAAEPPSGPDVSGVDWATVDLTTIDWATIDLRQVNWATIEDNPTGENLDEATVALIGERLDRGSATLTIGDQVWEFDNFLCAFGHEATESDVYAFSSLGNAEFDGVRLYVQADIRDDAGEARFMGPDVDHAVKLDTGQLDPVVRWDLEGIDLIQIDGYSVTASGTFVESSTGSDGGQVDGRLEATCGDASRVSP